MPKHIACVFGTRPEAIKMAPVIAALRQRPEDFKVTTICSGQHRELLNPLISFFDIKIDRNLDVMVHNQGLNGLLSKVVGEFGGLLSEERFDCVIGQGDTTTVLASALASFHEKIPFAHVEAGLRTHDLRSPFPEEGNRVLIGRLASFHFAPTDKAASNLLSEGTKAESVFMVGNTVIDALQHAAAHTTELPLHLRDKKLILVTAHRRENFGEPLRQICAAIADIAKARPDVVVVFPVHPNPNVRETAQSILSGIENVSLIDPVPYEQLVAMLKASTIVVTDSGGIQEEAPALGKPVLVLREETERPELMDAGGSKLVGSDRSLIVESINQLLDDPKVYESMVIGYSPYGDGKASQRIADVLRALL